MSNTGERYGSMKKARAAAEDVASVTGKAYGIHQATVAASPTIGWYVIAELTWSPISIEPEPEGTITYQHVSTVQPELEPDSEPVEVSSEALRDQMGADPALFDDDSNSEAFKLNLPDELLVELQHTRIEALERALKSEAERITEWRRYASELETKLNDSIRERSSTKRANLNKKRALEALEAEVAELKAKIVHERNLAAAVESQKQERIDELVGRLQRSQSESNGRRRQVNTLTVNLKAYQVQAENVRKAAGRITTKTEF